MKIRIRDDGTGRPDPTDPNYPTPGANEHVVNLGEDIGGTQPGTFFVEVQPMSTADKDLVTIQVEAANDSTLGAIARELIRLGGRI